MSAQGHIILSAFHIFIIVPAFLAVAFLRGQLPPWVFMTLFGVGLVILLYHAYKTILKWRTASPSVWVNILHVLVVAPILIFIGSKGYDTPRWAFEVLAMTGFAALGYHIYSIVSVIQDKHD